MFGLGGPWRPGDPSKQVGAASPPNFCEGFPGRPELPRPNKSRIFLLSLASHVSATATCRHIGIGPRSASTFAASIGLTCPAAIGTCSTKSEAPQRISAFASHHGKVTASVFSKRLRLRFGKLRHQAWCLRPRCISRFCPSSQRTMQNWCRYQPTSSSCTSN